MIGQTRLLRGTCRSLSITQCMKYTDDHKNCYPPAGNSGLLTSPFVVAHRLVVEVDVALDHLRPQSPSFRS